MHGVIDRVHAQSKLHK